MIEEHRSFQIPDINKKHHLEFEVNWQDDEETNKCKVLRVTYPDGKKAYLKKEHLLSMLFILGSPGEQRKMIPQKLTTIRNYETILGITAKKDIRKGDKINVRVKIPLPAVEEEVVAELKKQYKLSKVEKKK